MLPEFYMNYAIIYRWLLFNTLLNNEPHRFQIECTKMKHKKYESGHFPRFRKQWGSSANFEGITYIC